MSSHRLALAIVVSVILVVPALAQPAKKDEPSSGGKHALLVGVSNYPDLDKKFQLAGPANDVILMKDTLTKYFKFTDKEIVTLSEKLGEKDDQQFPTRANIEHEFKRLAKVVKDGDYVFIMMGGHGSQQPESGRGEPEADGLDEIFLPRDVGKWNDMAGTVKNAIVDKDIGEWLEAIQKKNASICIIFDSCHSGTMTRDGADEVKRQLNDPEDLGIPKKRIDEAVAKAEKREAESPKSRGVGGPAETNFKFAEKGGLVAIAAAQPNEPTVESMMPPKSKEGKPYGLLTFTICQVLTQAAENGSKPLTYRELAQRVQQHYSAIGRNFPTPVLEGGDRDREFLGNKVFEGRSDITLKKGPDSLKINAGSLHGLTKDSILSVKPPAGLGEKLIGYVKIKEVRVTECDVEAVEHEGVKAVADLPIGAVCKVAFVDYGDMKLRVALDSKNDAGGMIDPETKKTLVEICGKLQGPTSLIEIVDDPKKSNWIVRAVGIDRVVLIPAAGWAASTTASKDAAAFGPAKINEKLGEWLEASLSGIARAENLKAIVCRDDGVVGDAGAKFEVELTVNGNITKWPDPNILLFNKDKVSLRLKNVGRVGIDVTVLYLDSAFGIDCLFPDKQRGDFNRILPGEKSAPMVFTATSKTVGQENLLVIAVKSQGEAVDYSGLAQKSLDKYTRDVNSRGKPRPLDSLLKKGAYADGNTRGLSRDEDDAPQSMKMITWQIRPEKRPAPVKK